MNTPFYISRKLSLSSRRKSTPAVKVAVAAVAISIAVMLASIAIVLGFKNEVKEKIVGFNAHISLISNGNEGDSAGDNLVAVDKPLEELLDAIPFVKSYSIELSMPAILKTDSDFKGVYIKAFGSGADVSYIKEGLVEGYIPDFTKRESASEVVLSQIAADQLGLKAGDFINTYFITDDVYARKLKVAGVYNTHFEQYDDVFIFGSLSMLQEIAKIKSNQGTSVKIMTDDFSALEDNTRALSSTLVNAYADRSVDRLYIADNALHQGAQYFQWLDLLDMNVVVVLVLMLAVAVITLISGMLIIIIDKTRFIGIVRALGLSNRALSRVFVYLALRVALLGLVVGNVLMITLLVVQHYTHFIPLDAEAYYFDYVPVSLNWGAFLLLNAGTIILIFLTLLLPSRFVSRISPSRAMRYE